MGVCNILAAILNNIQFFARVDVRFLVILPESKSLRKGKYKRPIVFRSTFCSYFVYNHPDGSM
jgi:hypothetical protein